MKKITLLFAFLVAAFSYGQTSSGFVANPSFEDGLPGNIPKYQTLNNWKLGGNLLMPKEFQQTYKQLMFMPEMVLML